MHLYGACAPGERAAAELDALVRTTTALASVGIAGEIAPLSSRRRG